MVCTICRVTATIAVAATILVTASCAGENGVASGNGVPIAIDIGDHPVGPEIPVTVTVEASTEAWTSNYPMVMTVRCSNCDEPTPEGLRIEPEKVTVERGKAAHQSFECRVFIPYDKVGSEPELKVTATILRDHAEKTTRPRPEDDV